MREPVHSGGLVFLFTFLIKYAIIINDNSILKIL